MCLLYEAIFYDIKEKNSRKFYSLFNPVEKLEFLHIVELKLLKNILFVRFQKMTHLSHFWQLNIYFLDVKEISKINKQMYLTVLTHYKNNTMRKNDFHIILNHLVYKYIWLI